MKSVLIAIQPKWCKLIASGKKTVEVRKTKPKLETPFKCYIYMTKSNDTIFGYGKPKKLCVDSGYVIGEFVCDNLIWVLAHPSIFAGHPLFYSQAINDACLTQDEVEKYSGGKDVYGWHISDLVIYDKPRKLSEFTRSCDGVRGNIGCNGCQYYYTENNENTGLYEGCECDGSRPITRPPQNWCYVKSEEQANDNT